MEGAVKKPGTGTTPLKKILDTVRPLALFALVLGASCSPRICGELVTIGAIFPLTGESYIQGIHAATGAQFAKDEINNGPGVGALGKKLDIVVMNCKGEAAHALKQYNLLKNSGVAAIVGCAHPKSTAAVAAQAALDGVPFIDPSSLMDAVVAGGGGQLGETYFFHFSEEPPPVAIATYVSVHLLAKAFAEVGGTERGAVAASLGRLQGPRRPAAPVAAPGLE